VCARANVYGLHPLLASSSSPGPVACCCRGGGAPTQPSQQATAFAGAAWPSSRKSFATPAGNAKQPQDTGRSSRHGQAAAGHWPIQQAWPSSRKSLADPAGMAKQLQVTGRPSRHGQAVASHWPLQQPWPSSCRSLAAPAGTAKQPQVRGMRARQFRLACTHPAAAGLLPSPLPHRALARPPMSPPHRLRCTQDVDGFHPQNIGKLAMRGRTPLYVPCTPKVGGWPQQKGGLDSCKAVCPCAR